MFLFSFYSMCSIECDKEREKVHYFYFVCHIKFMYDSAHGTLNVRSYFKYHFNNIVIAQRLFKITYRDLRPISNINTFYIRILCFHGIRVIFINMDFLDIFLDKLIALLQNIYSCNIRVEISVQAAATRRLRIIINRTHNKLHLTYKA